MSGSLLAMVPGSAVGSSCTLQDGATKVWTGEITAKHNSPAAAVETMGPRIAENAFVVVCTRRRGGSHDRMAWPAWDGL